MHGFEEIRKIKLGELDAVMHEMRHKKTGLKLVWLERDEENKTYGIAFPTFPSDDTGVFHIIEHSVLCGSKRYPLKDPFVELLKSSMNTFLNALTFDDKTFYPISSKNDKDFMNLMRVYTDAVFNPSIYTTPECFMQEGWHYELDDNGELTYKGVVFNEMKGVFADPDARLDYAISRALFPDNAYGFVSGGDPAHIPDLTYEQFLAAHKKHYSPANAFVILDGKVDIDAVLAVLDDEFLCDIEAGKAVDLPALQSPVDAGITNIEYEISPDENPENRNITAWGRVIGRFDEIEKITAVKALSDLLCGSLKSPLNACILTDGLAETVNVSLSDITLQPTLTICVKNFKEENADEIEKRIFDTLKNLAENGIDRDQINAALTHLEFKMRERDYGSYPQGLVFGMSILESWLYGGKPEANLEVGELFKSLRSKMGSGYFENIIKEAFIDNCHCCRVNMTPSKTAGEESRSRESERLRQALAAFTDNEKDGIKQAMARLLKWQNTPDSPQAIATLPKLTLADITAKPENLPTEVKNIGGVPALLHKVGAGGILYFSLYFDVNDCDENDLSTLAFATALLGELGTKNYTAEQMMNIKRILCGDISCNVVTFADRNSADCRAYLKVGFSAIEENAEKAFALIIEILTSTDFSQSEDVLSILCQTRALMQQIIVADGVHIAMGRAEAQLMPSGVVKDCTFGYNLYKWLKTTEENGEHEKAAKAAQRLLEKIICKDRLTLSVTGNADEKCEDIIKSAVGTLDEHGERLGGKITPWGLRREGIVIPADVSFSVSACDIKTADCAYSGSALVGSKLVGLNYLWNVIRMQGGAYGTGMATAQTGFNLCYSYRDPSPSSSLESFKTCGKYLTDAADDGTDITGFIIGTISDISPVLTPKMKGSAADRLYFCNVSYDDRCREMQEIVATSADDLKQFGEALQKCADSSALCVVGNQQQLEKCSLDEISVL